MNKPYLYIKPKKELEIKILRVIKDPVEHFKSRGFKSTSEILNKFMTDNFSVDSITWIYVKDENPTYYLIEDNRYGQMPKQLFEEVIIRFKTESEFRRDNQWCDDIGAPIGWNSFGEMNQYLGTFLDEIGMKTYILSTTYANAPNIQFSIPGIKWSFRKSNFVFMNHQEAKDFINHHKGLPKIQFTKSSNIKSKDLSYSNEEIIPDIVLIKKQKRRLL